MKLAVITAALYPDVSRIHYLADSAQRNNVVLQPFGIGARFGNWKEMLLKYTLPTMATLAESGYTHALYVDGSDSMFIGGIQEIVSKFGRLGSPACLMSGDPDPPFINAGGFLTDIPYFVQLMSSLPEKYGHDGDYQNWIVKYVAEQGLNGLGYDMLVDHECSIFQSIIESPSVIQVGGRMVNTITGQWPCVLHFRGGYSCPDTGRDYRMKPYFDSLFGGQGEIRV